MKKISNLLLVCSLALAGAVMAQQPTPEESQAPGKKPDKKAPAEVKPRGPQAPKHEAPKSEAPAVKEPAAAATTQAPAANEPAATKPNRKNAKGPKTAPTTAPETKPSTDQSATSATTPATDKKQNANQRRKDKSPAANASTTPSTNTSPAAATTASTPPGKTKASASPAAATTATTPAATAAASTAPATAASSTPAAGATTTPATAASASAAPSVAAQTSPGASVNPVATAKKPDPAKVQQIRQQYTSFRAQPRPDRVPAVSFNAGFRLPGAERWQGPQYEVYRSYHPERHDRGWYSSHYPRVELIAGGYYYFNNNYWYPAWGYDPGHEYYAYDAPIYSGKHAEPPDKVIASVQAALQEMGYYKGEVDGLIGPLTRDALTKYQTDNGMTVTAVIDEPTLDALGMG
jgi:hypothetical protein